MADFQLIQTGEQVQEILNQVPENTTDIQSLESDKVDKEAGKGLSEANFTDSEKTKLGALPTRAELTTEEQALQTQINGKQANISDLQTIREGAAKGATAYQKPQAGIPITDMNAEAQAAINGAASAAADIAAERLARETADLQINSALGTKLNQSQVEAIVSAALANYDTAAEVATAISTALASYYTKAQSYSKSEVDALVAPKQTQAQVESIVAAALADYDTAAEVATAISTALASYYTKSQTYSKTEVDNLLSPKQTAAQVQAIVASALASYSTTDQVATAITNALAAYYTKTAMDAIIAGLQTKLTFDTAPVQNSQNPVQSGGIYTAIANAVNGLVNSTYVQNAITTALANYSTTAQISAMITTALTTTLANYYTKAETDQHINAIVGTIQAQASQAAASAGEAEEKADDAAASAAAANQKLIDLETYLSSLDPESAASVAAALGLLTEEVHNDYAKKDGMYNDMTVGNAMNIISEDIVTEQTTLGHTAPNSEIGNGSARMQTIEGDGVAWSQLYDKMAGGSSVASEQAQLEFLFGKVVERFSNNAGTTPMPSLFLREFLTGADLTGRVAVSGEGFVPAVTEENQSNYTGLHYKVRATHAEAVQRSGEEGSYSYSSAFFVGGANFSASAKRNVIDMALAFGIDAFGAGGTAPFDLPTSAPSTLAQMYGWLGQKVGLSDDYDYNGGELIGVKVLQLRSMPGVNLLDPTSGVALCPYYEWENADGLYRIAAKNGAVISGVVATALGGQPVAVVEVTAGSVYEVSVPEGDAVVMQVTLSSGSLTDCACWQVWDDSTPVDEVGGYTRSVLSLEVGRVYGKLNGEGEYVAIGDELRGVPELCDILDIVGDTATLRVKKQLCRGNETWYTQAVANSNNRYFLSVNLGGAGIRSNQLPKTYTYAGRIDGVESNYIYNQLCVLIKQYKTSTDFKAYIASLYSAGNPLIIWYCAVVSDYVRYSDLMYDTRPDLTVGEPVLVPLSTYFPGTYQVGNTGVTMQTQNWDDQTQRFAGTPQSASAQTSSVMPGNYVEMLRSLQQKNILDGWVSPDQFHAHQAATVQSLNAMATANQLSGQFTLTPQDDVAYSNE